MLNFSFASLSMAIITSNILLIILYLTLKHKSIMLSTGYRLLTIFVLLTILRFLLPFEFPRFSHNIYYPEFLSKVISGFLHPRFSFGQWDFSIWTLFEFIWSIGIIIGLLHYINIKRNFHSFVWKNGIDITQQAKYKATLNKICHERKKSNKFTVIELPCIKTPMIYGVKSPYILMPNYLKLSNKELYYVLSHEAAHYFQYDLLMKSFIQLICIFYWWNPFCYLLKLQTNTLLEMRVDQKLTAKDTKAKYEYAQCLLELSKSSVDATSAKVAIPFCGGDSSMFVQRFHMLLKGQDISISKPTYILIVLFVLFLYSSSFFFILEASYISPEIEANTFELTDENAFIIELDTETYQLYINNEYVKSFSSLENFPHNIKIFKSLEEVTAYEKD